MNTNNIYLVRALDAYPYEMEKAIEALNYALSYESNNATALGLMAKIQAEFFQDRNKAIEYFEAALSAKIDAVFIYPDYIHVLIQNEDYEAAQKLIDFALTQKGVDRARVKLNEAQMLEELQEYEMAEVAYKETLDLGMNNGFIDYVKDELSRSTKKMERQKRKEQKVSDKEVKKSTSPTQSWFKNRLNNLL